MIKDEGSLYSNWSNREIAPTKRLEKAHNNSIETLAVNIATPNVFATGSHDRLVKIWDLNAGMKHTATLAGH